VFEQVGQEQEHSRIVVRDQNASCRWNGYGSERVLGHFGIRILVVVVLAQCFSGRRKTTFWLELELRLVIALASPGGVAGMLSLHTDLQSLSGSLRYTLY
jgi:hypothetical protein